MPRRREMRAVLHNFLETYASRYSEHNGYWLFGQLPAGFERLDFDLLRSRERHTEDVVIAAAAGLAATMFHRQLAAAGFPQSYVREASLKIVRLPGTSHGQLNVQTRVGSRMRLLVWAVSDHGKVYQSEKQIFVAPHDPAVELRSTR